MTGVWNIADFDIMKDSRDSGTRVQALERISSNLF